MNSILKALLGTNKPNIIKPEIIEIKRKAPRTPKVNNKDIKKSEDVITEKEIQAAMKRIKKVEAEARKRIAEEELKTHNSAMSPPKSGAKSAVKSAAPKKKQPIPNHVKTLLWNHWVGCDKAETYCLCCKVTKISIRSFHAGHIIAESKGGDMTVKNLKPICGPCNLSMGSTNMDEFIKKFGLGK
jgi:5-methylcytosine-specific restriction endonuclease McrA